MAGETSLVVGRIVYTPLGTGKIVYVLKDGGLLVQFEHGGGHIYRPEELFPRKFRFNAPDRDFALSSL